jgi:hypothetical protein
MLAAQPERNGQHHDAEGDRVRAEPRSSMMLLAMSPPHMAG